MASRARNLDQRCGAAAAASRPDGLARRRLWHFARRGRRRYSGRLLTRRELEQRLQRANGLVDAFGRIADSGKPCRHRVDGECAGLTVRHLGPAQRRRHPCVRTWSDRVRRRGRMVLGVLVVVDEHAVALFFPPLAGGNLGRTSFDFAGQGDRGAANFGERPPRRNPCVDVESARA